ncbi:MAG: 3-deoxy-D-manno-octulosonic acid transferase [Thermodesulfovibrionia bacterium]
MMFPIYNLLSFISLIAYLPWILLKKGPENRLAYVIERFGISTYANADIWIHAVSVGETIACLPFMSALKKEFPEIKILFSTTTYTGQKIVREKSSNADRVMYMPWDTRVCVTRAVKTAKPKIFITIETELWPALFRALKNEGSKIIILNGRLSNKSYRGYRRIRPFMQKVLSYVDYCYMQSKDDAYRIMSIGAQPERVGVMGNFKFDVDLHKSHNSSVWMNRINGKILVAGSTHRGEEEIILNAYEIIKKSMSDLKLILAPRHPERFSEVEEILKKRGLNYIRRSEIKRTQMMDNGQQKTTGRLSPDIILLDTIGELSQVFSKAAVVFIGGSLVPVGGHNILEPAYWGKPIVFGPHMENFPVASEFLREDAALMLKDSKGITTAIKDLLKDNKKAEQMGQKAKAIIDSNTGAVEKALNLVRSFLGTA